jgi:hypothetical protein
MGNRCELPINVVRTSKSKMLRDLNQKVSGVGYELPLLIVADEESTGERVVPNPSSGT